MGTGLDNDIVPGDSYPEPIPSEPNAAASEIVRRYVLAHLDKSDPRADFDVYVVWQCCILGNRKWLLSTTLPDGMYYEVTFNAAAREYYLDAYKKFENVRVRAEEDRYA